MYKYIAAVTLCKAMSFVRHQALFDVPYLSFVTAAAYRHLSRYLQPPTLSPPHVHLQSATMHPSLAPALLLLLAATTSAEQCLHPPPSPDYTNALYAGQWFEVQLLHNILDLF